MKLKEYLEQFKHFDPELEVYIWYDRGMKKIHDGNVTDDIRLRYIKNDNSLYTENFRITKNSEYDKLVIVIP